MDAQVRATQPVELRLQSASPVRRPDSPPTHASNVRVAPRTASSQTPTKTGPATRQDHTNSTTRTPTPHDHDKSMNHKTPAKSPEARVPSAFYLQGAQRFAPPRFRLRLPSSFFEKLLEKGRALSPPPRVPCGGRGKSVLAQVQGINLSSPASIAGPTQFAPSPIGPIVSPRGAAIMLSVVCVVGCGCCWRCGLL